MRAAVRNFNTGTGAAGTTVVVSGLGFAPKAVILTWSGRTETTDTVGSTDINRGMGVGVSASARGCLGTGSDNAAGTSVCSWAFRTDGIVLSMANGSTTVDGVLDIQSFDTDGVTFIVDDAFPTSLRVSALFLGGNDLLNADVQTFTLPGVTGDQDITSFAFQPDFILIMPSNNATAPPTTGAHSRQIFGMATASQQGVCGAMGEDAQATSDTWRYCNDAEVMFKFNNAGGLGAQATFVTMLSNGFRINWSSLPGGAHNNLVLALRGGNYEIGNFLTATSVSDVAVSGLGFRPAGLLFASHCKAESAVGTTNTEDEFSIGLAASPSEQACQATEDEDTQGTIVCGTAVEHDSIYANISTAQAIEGRANLKSIDPNGFTITQDDADPSQSFVLYAAFGPREDVMPFVRHTRHVYY